MSTQATTWAYEQHGLSSGAKFLLVTIANYADPAGVAWPGRAALAADCACSPKSVSVHMGTLEQAGLIGRRERRRKNGSRTSDWIVLAPSCADRAPMRVAPAEEFPSMIVELTTSGEESLGEVSGQGQVKISGGPEPSEEPPLLRRGRERARASLPKYAGKPVKGELWELTQAVLGVFNARTGKSLGALTSGGELSDAAKRIYGRVKAWPDLTLADHEQIIDQTLASEWWDGEVSIGVVYGPHVFERNKDGDRGPSRKAAKTQKDRERQERMQRGVAAIHRIQGRAA